MPTVYPLISQIVFAGVASLTPENASVAMHVVVMKAAIVLFDLLTIASMIWMLRLCRLSPAYAISYAWNPLVLKEFAGSGHLDSIAVFFTVTAVALLVRARVRCHDQQYRVVSWMVPSMLLAAGFGAKLYPVVLLPLFFAFALRSSATWRIGSVRIAMMSVAFGTVAGLCVVPLMMPQSDANIHSPPRSESTTPVDSLVPPVPNEVSTTPTTTATDGFKAFFSSWQMNDVIFGVLSENLRYEECFARR